MARGKWKRKKKRNQQGPWANLHLRTCSTLSVTRLSSDHVIVLSTTRYYMALCYSYEPPPPSPLPLLAVNFLSSPLYTLLGTNDLRNPPPHYTRRPCDTPDLKEKKVTTGFLSPVQTVVIGDDSFNYHARLNTNCYRLSATITNYHEFWTCSNSIW